MASRVSGEWPAAKARCTDQLLPLEGIRVIDLTQNLPGPYASQLLANLGAEVIKIEPPQGDTARGIGRIFEYVNRGKRSVVLDLKEEGGRAALRDLLETADVLLEGFRPGVMARLGFSADDVRGLNDRVVYCSISGYGQQGQRSGMPGHDINYQSLVGACHAQRDENGRPHAVALPIADLSAALNAVISILAALYGRDCRSDGGSRHLDVAMTDMLLSWTAVWTKGLDASDLRIEAAAESTRLWLARNQAGFGDLAARAGSLAERLLSDPRAGRLAALGDRLLQRAGVVEALDRLRLHALPHYDLFRTRDGRYLSVGILQEDRFWKALARSVGLAGMADVPFAARFVLAPVVRVALATAIGRRKLTAWLQQIDLDETAVAPVRSVDEALADEGLQRRQVAACQGWGSPLAIGATHTEPPPRLGEHTAEVLSALPSRHHDIDPF